MQINYTLKQAVKTALTILAVSAQTNVMALGLGNIEVTSSLGQPLRASIKIQGASELKNVDCFRVINDSNAENQLNNANFKLSKVVDDVAILTVTTNQVLYEPIVNLSVLAECNANMRRDYVVLLDPVLSADLERPNNEAPDAESLTNVNQGENITEVVSASRKNSVQTSAKIVKATKANKKSYVNKKSKQNIVLSAGYDKPSANSSNTATTSIVAANSAKAAGPRLSISGGEMSTMPSNSPQLRMDKQLQFTPENAPLSLTKVLSNDIEIQDEVTVINNRLAHLNKQIEVMAQQNKTLQANNQSVSQQLNEVNAANKLDWLGYILGGALLFASYNIASKWRLRRQEQLFEDAQLALGTEYLNPLSGLNAGDSFFDLDKDQGFSQEVEEAKQDVAMSEIDPDALFSPDNTPKNTPFSVEEFNEDHNILDHADVFLSHGRTSLAIELLQNHLLEYPKQSVTVWLFLLDLLAKDNMQAVYEQTTLECKEHFNIRIAAFSNDEGSSKQHLEDFPRLIAGLEQLWGTPAAQVYLDDLIYNSRLENRVGFEKSVLEELLLLKDIAHDAISTAQVIQLDDKKLALKAQKEAKLAADKEHRIKKVNALIEQKIADNRVQNTHDSNENMFEFTLTEYN